MGSAIPIIMPFIKKAATSFLVSTVTNKIFGNKSSSSYSANSGAFSSEEQMAGAQEASAILVNKNSNNASIPVVYGRRRVGGTRVLIETSDGAGDLSGTKYLVMVVAISDGINLVGWPTRCYFNEEVVWDSSINGTIDYNVTGPTDSGNGGLRNFIGGGPTVIGGPTLGSGGSDCFIRWHRGAAEPALLPDATVQQALGAGVWTNAHQLQGMNYASILLGSNPAYFEGTLPTITFEFDGAQLVNTQTLAATPTHATYLSASETTPADGANPADVLYDLLTSPMYGKGLDFDPQIGQWVPGRDIDLDSFATARAYCNEIVTRNGQSVKRYTINGVVQTSSKIFENIDMVVNSFNGMLIYSGGKYVLKIRQPNEASVYTFTKDEIIGDIEVNLSGSKQRINRVAVSYANPNNSYNDDIHIVFDEVAFAEDGYRILEVKIDQPLITDTDMIDALARYKIDMSRNTMTINFVAPHTAMIIECGDIIDITHTIFGWTNKQFRVLSLEILSDNTVEITALEYVSAIEL